MTWLQPAVIASIVTSAIITLIYLYIYIQYRQINFLFWTLSWIFGIARFVVTLIIIQNSATPLITILSELFPVYNALFLALGIAAVFNTKQFTYWIGTSAVVSAWIILGVLIRQPFLLITLPSYLFSGTAFIISGILFIYIYKKKAKMNYLVGITLILHGLHKYDYPFLRNDLVFAPFGFLMNSMFTLVVAFGIVLLFFEKEHRELTEQEQMLSSLFDQSPLPIILSDRSGNILSINKKLTTLLNYKLDDINTPELWFSNAYPDIKYRNYVIQEFQKAVENLNNDLDPAPKVFQVSDFQGVKHTIEFHYTRVGENILFILNDLTEKKKIEDELFNIRRLESLGVLAGGIAHDFNNILTGISGNIELASMKSAADSETYAYLENSKKALFRATALTQQLMTFAKGDLTQTEIISIRELIEESVQFVLTGSNISPVMDIVPDLWPIEANKGQISQVINNLVINAKQAMPEGGTIFISAFNETAPPVSSDQEEKYIKITIKDQGSGIPEDIMEKIFDPYFTTKSTGSGLGLATSFSIISRYNGRISCVNNQDKGCTFTIILPSVPEKKLENSSVTRRNDFKPSTDTTFLVIDDDLAILKILENFLSEKKFRIITACDGSEGLTRVYECLKNQQKIDLIITDLTIPGKMGGMEFMEKLHQLNLDIPVILMSGYAEIGDINTFLQKGFEHFIQKPFQLENLFEIIQKILYSRTLED